MCSTCGTHGGTAFICHGVSADWHDDSQALDVLQNGITKERLTGYEAGVQHLAKLGVLDITFNEEGDPWIGMNMVTAQWYSWAAIRQNRQRMDGYWDASMANFVTIEDRLESIEETNRILRDQLETAGVIPSA